MSRTSQIYPCKEYFSWGKVFEETNVLVFEYTQNNQKYTQICTQTLTYGVCREIGFGVIHALLSGKNVPKEFNPGKINI